MSYSYINSLSSHETNYHNISSYANKDTSTATKVEDNTKKTETTDKATTTKSNTSASNETVEDLLERLNNTTNNIGNIFSSFNNSSTKKDSSFDAFSNLSSLANTFNSMKSAAYLRTVKNYYKNMQVSNNNTATDNTASKLQSAKLMDLKDSLKSINKNENSIKLNINSAITNRNLNLIENGSDDDKSYMNDLVNSISDFANSYNSMIDKSSDIESTSVLNNILSMTKMTRYNATSLSNIGITLGSDNKLTVNKEQLKNADLDNIDSLFGQNGSFGDYTSSKASSLSYNCINQIKSQLTEEKYNTISSYLGTSNLGNYLDNSY